ncbi:hypothetical protein EVAR_59148_1 [Eumeta japonica]|uniref:Uncharacterized protein n=1 Tax=Eumeta variegata TaxID=151549 RepID=A0A4C1ZBC9_EUMVA|nr:hypothetical protein EVAR_59148_1 [Eumeta japonica]
MPVYDAIFSQLRRFNSRSRRATSARPPRGSAADENPARLHIALKKVGFRILVGFISYASYKSGRRAGAELIFDLDLVRFVREGVPRGLCRLKRL